MPTQGRLRGNVTLPKIDGIDAAVRCYEGATNQGQISVAGRNLGWLVKSFKTGLWRVLDYAAILAMAITECCAESGRGKVFWVCKGGPDMRKRDSPWTSTTTEAPNLLYTDFIWNDHNRNEWFQSPHWARLDMLNATAQGLNLNVLTMPISLTYEHYTYDNIRIEITSAAVVVTFNPSGYTYLGYIEDMVEDMWYTKFDTGGTKRSVWQGDKSDLPQFQMLSGPQIVTRLRQMWLEARPESLRFFRSIIDDLIRGHVEWVANGGYTIASDPGLGPELASKYEAAVRNLEAYNQTEDRLSELRLLTGLWDPPQRSVLQNLIDTANDGGLAGVADFLEKDEGWLALDQDEREIALELWKLEDESDRREAIREIQAQAQAQTQAQSHTQAQSQTRARTRAQTRTTDNTHITNNRQSTNIGQTTTDARAPRNVQNEEQDDFNDDDLPGPTDMDVERESYIDANTYNPASLPHLVDMTVVNITPHDMNSYSWGLVYNLVWHYSKIPIRDRKDQEPWQALQRVLGPLEVPNEVAQTKISLLSYIRLRQKETWRYERDAGEHGGWANRNQGNLR